MNRNLILERIGIIKQCRRKITSVANEVEGLHLKNYSQIILLNLQELQEGFDEVLEKETSELRALQSNE